MTAGALQNTAVISLLREKMKSTFDSRVATSYGLDQATSFVAASCPRMLASHLFETSFHCHAAAARALVILEHSRREWTVDAGWNRLVNYVPMPHRTDNTGRMLRCSCESQASPSGWLAPRDARHGERQGAGLQRSTNTPSRFITP